MKPISCNQEIGDTERLLCPGALQGPARIQFEETSGQGCCQERMVSAYG